MKIRDYLMQRATQNRRSNHETKEEKYTPKAASHLAVGILATRGRGKAQTAGRRARILAPAPAHGSAASVSSAVPGERLHMG